MSEPTSQPRLDAIVSTQWHAYFSVHGDPSVVTDQSRPVFTEVCKVSKSPDDYGQANARLIAAAPDLLECVQAMLAEYEEGLTPRFDLREMCRAAVAKSKGEIYE
jgi:hypothetical protein